MCEKLAPTRTPSLLRLAPLPTQSIKQVLHSHGVNLRYLGYVRHCVKGLPVTLPPAPGGGPAATSLTRRGPAADLLVEALARTVKWDLWAAMRRGHVEADALAVADNPDEGVPHVHERVAARWNKLFFKAARLSEAREGAGSGSVVTTLSTTVPYVELKLRRRFPGCLAHNEHLPMFDPVGRKGDAGGGGGGGGAAPAAVVINVIGDFEFLVARCAQAVGLELTEDGLKVLTRGGRMLAEHVVEVRRGLGHGGSVSVGGYGREKALWTSVVPLASVLSCDKLQSSG